MDVLQWWGLNEDRFPNVARMAAQYLACPASSATVERFFSLAGRILDKRTVGMKERVTTGVGPQQELFYCN